MRKYIFILPIVLYVACAMADVFNPYGGRILISGAIQDNSCTVSPDTTNFEVFLGNVGSKQFKNAGDHSQSSLFSIDLENCGAAATGVSLTFTGNADKNNSALLALNSDADSASGIGVAILDSAQNQIPVNNPSKEYQLDPNKKENILQFYAYYSATGPSVTAGSANSTATFSLTYQ